MNKFANLIATIQFAPGSKNRESRALKLSIIMIRADRILKSRTFGLVHLHLN